MEKTVKLELVQVEAEILEHFLEKKATVTGVAAMEACISLYRKTKKALDEITETPPPKESQSGENEKAVEVPPK